MADPRRLDRLRIDRSAEPADSPWRRRWLLLGLSIVLVGGALLWFFSGSGLAVKTAPVTSVQGGVTRAASVLDASGYVVARRKATVASKVTGRLTEVLIEEGMAVEHDQVIARLDDSNARHALALAEARAAAAQSALTEIQVRLKEADRDLGRMRDLAATGVASRQQLDAAQATRDSFAARLDAARDDVTVAEREIAVRKQEVDDTVVRSPFAGVAVSKDAQPGEIVSPMSAGGGFTRTGISTIVDMGSLEIEVDVNESFIQRVRNGQAVIATLQAYPEWKIPAHVITTVPSADRQKATVKVRIAFDQLGDPRILPDMGVKVAFQAPAEDGSEAASARQGMAVPERAVRREGETSVVFVVRDDRVERRAVSVGGTTGDGQVVVSGVRSGDRVVVDPPADLADGAEVRRSDG